MDRHGLGLRLQIVVALTLAFVLAFGLLGIVVVHFTYRFRANDRIEAARSVAEALIRASAPSRLVTADASSDRFVQVADAAIGQSGVRGVSLVQGSQTVVSRGAVGLGVPVEVPFGAQTLRLWVHVPSYRANASRTRLLLLYIVLTGSAILVLTYLGLTFLIVRPVEALTHASERLADGKLGTHVPVQGAAEPARLAIAFNRMAAQLRLERDRLEHRLVELQSTTEELASTQGHLIRSARLASVGRLSAGIAHEIGNPLSAVLGLIELLRDPSLGAAERDELLARVEAETGRIHRIIGDLLDFARSDSRDEAVESVRLAEVVDDALRLLEPQKDLRDVRFERVLAPDAPPVAARRDRLTQVLLNLALNAADAIDGAGVIRVEVRTAAPPPHVAAGGRPWVELAVSDSGPGVAPELRESIFEPFVTTKPPGQGTGLGLAVCHTIIEVLGGSIHVRDSSLGGACFVALLPPVPEDASVDGPKTGGRS